MAPSTYIHTGFGVRQVKMAAATSARIDNQ